MYFHNLKICKVYLLLLSHLWLHDLKLIIWMAEDFLYKNKLQEYAQKSLIPLPIYQTINEGKQHAPKFRSFVMIDGVGFVSSSTFSNRKEAEQDAARIALEGILQKTKQEGMHLIHQVSFIFCILCH